jgi:outer membrane protein OmpA-like peptidoglycan-associated protein
MRIHTGSAIAAAGMLLLSGCAWDIEGTSKMPNQGDAFAKALQQQYLERAKYERHEEDWISVDFFTSRAQMAADGHPPVLQKPSDRHLEKDVAEIGSGYQRLSSALAAGAAKSAPEACARSQAWFEHWMEQSEEGHQADDIAWTRAEFMKAVPDCAVPAPKPAAMSNQAGEQVWRVFFPFDKSTLSNEAKTFIDRIVSAYQSQKPSAVTVTGHADASGTGQYNMALSERRATAVVKALADKGVPSTVVNERAVGENNLPKPTADGVKEPENRQVTVTFQK